jgi:hypothetical protein
MQLVLATLWKYTVRHSSMCAIHMYMFPVIVSVCCCICCWKLFL